MWFLRLVKSWHKFFGHKSCLAEKSKLLTKMHYQTHEFWTWAANFSFRSMEKIDQIAPYDLSTLYQYSVSLPCTLQHTKNLDASFSVSARYDSFQVSTWPKIKNLIFSNKTKTDCLLETNHWHFIMRVKMFHFWPWQKSKCAPS